MKEKYLMPTQESGRDFMMLGILGCRIAGKTKQRGKFYCF